MKAKLGYIGIVIGIIAIAIAIFQDDLRSPAPEPTPVQVEEGKTLKEQAIAAGKKKLSEKLFGKKEVAPKEAEVETSSKRDKIEILYMSLGILALALGAFSWAKKEHHRVASAAVALGLIAVAWQFVLIGVSIAVVLYIIANFDVGWW